MIDLAPGCEERIYNIENRETFVILSLLSATYKDVFSNTQKASDTANAIHADALHKYETGVVPLLHDNLVEPLVTLQREVETCRGRWSLLDKIELLVGQTNDARTTFPRVFIARSLRTVKKKIFDRLNDAGTTYINSDAFRNRKHETSVIDVAFAASMIEPGCFDVLITLTPIFTFFPSHHDDKPIDYSQHTHALNDIRYAAYSICYNSRRNIRDVRATDFVSNHEFRNFNIRDNIMSSMIVQLYQNVYEDAEEETAPNQLFDQVFRLDNIMSWFAQTDPEHKDLLLIGKWDIPHNLLLHVLRTLSAVIKESVHHNNNKERIEGGLMINNWCDARFGKVFQRVLAAPEKLDLNLMREVTQALVLTNGVYVFRALLHDHKPEVSFIKDLALFMAQNKRTHANMFTTLIDFYPWIFDTWLDRCGNTLLCLCVINGYERLDKVLQHTNIKNRIDVESKDGLTPLMLAADFPAYAHIFEILLANGADPTHVNRHHESVMHRIAGSNNTNLAKEVHETWQKATLELRRNNDMATPIMIALVRQHVKLSEHFLKLGAQVTTKFGSSGIIRTVEAMCLMSRPLSQKMLQKEGFKCMSEIIVKGFLTQELFLEEPIVAHTGMFDMGRLCLTPLTLKYDHGRRGDLPWNIYHEGVPNSLDGMSRSLVGATWQLFNEPDKCLKLKWPEYIISNNIKKLKRWLIDNKKSKEAARKREPCFKTDSCRVCLCSLFNKEDAEVVEGDGGRDDENDYWVGKTECGHFFHASCWKKTGGKICPLCRQRKKFRCPIDRMAISKDIPCVIRKFPREALRHRERSEGHYFASPRYDFFIEGEWVDEINIHISTCPQIIGTCTS
uniref:RING-type domain-containing protein n=1 Tax=Chionoecetes opilio bacilliform virus TaxID=1825681 RepID=A0A1Q3DL00_9VIRU|nr:hypothetical protein SCV_057 [Chionoecetes opilio bacilliform virus]